MKRGVLAVGVSLLIFGALTGLAAARSTTTVGMSAQLKVTKQAAAKLPNASGRFTGTLLRFSNGRSKLTWQLTYKSLGSRATQARLVIAPSKKYPAGISVQLCRPCSANSRGVVNPILKPSTSVLATGPGSIVVFTKRYPTGAIRGPIVRSG